MLIDVHGSARWRVAALALGLLVAACGPAPSGGSDDDDDDGDGGSDGGADDGGHEAEEAFARAYADAICRYYDDCDLLDYAGGDLQTCLEVNEESVLAWLLSEGCVFDQTLTDACLDQVAALSCDPTGAQMDACEALCDGGG